MDAQDLLGALAPAMTDAAARRGLRIDERKLSTELGVPVVSTDAPKGAGLQALVSRLQDQGFGINISPVYAGYSPEIFLQKIHLIMNRVQKLPMEPKMVNLRLAHCTLTDGSALPARLETINLPVDFSLSGNQQIKLR